MWKGLFHMWLSLEKKTLAVKVLESPFSEHYTIFCRIFRPHTVGINDWPHFKCYIMLERSLKMSKFFEIFEKFMNLNEIANKFDLCLTDLQLRLNLSFQNIAKNITNLNIN